MNRSQKLEWVAVCLTVGLGLAVLGCRRKQAESKLPEPVPAGKAKAQVLEFPQALWADDEALNDCVRRVVQACASGDYQAFSKLWTSQDDPFPQEQFFKAWQYLRRVEIVGLRPVRHPQTGDILYAGKAHVLLDPTLKEPERDVTMLFVKEEGGWRLTTPPDALPDSLFDKPATSGPGSRSAGNASNSPRDSASLPRP